MWDHLPVKQPRPDARGFIDILMGRVKGTRTPLVEYIVDPVVMKPVVVDLLGRAWVDLGESGETVRQPWRDMEEKRAAQRAYLDNFIDFWHRLGYDCVRFEQSLGFTERRLVAPDPAPGSTQQRAWVDQHRGAITSWADFEGYPWPQVEEMDFFAFEYINDHLPEGMGFMSCHAGGPFEHLSQIMSYEGLCLALYDAPDLVQAVVDKIGELMTGFYRHLLDLDHLVAVFQGDDMGFKTATLVAPSELRRYTLPLHKRFAGMAHARGLPYFVHSCGNLAAIMEDLIADVGIDGKHSYEDAIIPVEEFQARYGDRIAVLGGVDINILAGGSPEDVRRKTRALVETCGSRGRFAVGSGNSIPSYIPVANYLAMVDEALALM